MSWTKVIIADFYEYNNVNNDPVRIDDGLGLYWSKNGYAHLLPLAAFPFCSSSVVFCIPSVDDDDDGWLIIVGQFWEWMNE